MALITFQIHEKIPHTPWTRDSFFLFYHWLSFFWRWLNQFDILHNFDVFFYFSFLYYTNDEFTIMFAYSIFGILFYPFWHSMFSHCVLVHFLFLLKYDISSLDVERYSLRQYSTWTNNWHSSIEYDVNSFFFNGEEADVMVLLETWKHSIRLRLYSYDIRFERCDHIVQYEWNTCGCPFPFSAHTLHFARDVLIVACVCHGFYVLFAAWTFT